MINTGYDFSDFFYGKVIKVNEDTKEIAVYIPKLMHVISGTSEHKTKTATIDKNLNLDQDLNILEEVTLKNCIWAKPYNYSITLPSVGSDIGIIFFENDPKRPMWFHFNPNGTNGYYLESEEHPELFTTSINNEKVVIKDGSTLDITLNEDQFEVLKREGRYSVSIKPAGEIDVGLDILYDTETGTKTFILKNSEGNIISTYDFNEMEQLIENTESEDLLAAYIKISLDGADYKLPLSFIAGIISAYNSSSFGNIIFEPNATISDGTNSCSVSDLIAVVNAMKGNIN